MTIESSTDENVAICLDGAYDMHVHSAPDIMERKSNDIELAQMAMAAKMGGFVIKSHYHSTADRAYLVNKVVSGVNVLGSICLNNSVGGINPIAVDIFGRSAGKVVWMPTVDSENESKQRSKVPDTKLPYWALVQKELVDSGLSIFPIQLKDDKNRFSEQVSKVLETIKKYGMILASGHISPSETLELVEYAAGLGLKKFIITHPEFPTTNFTLAQQRKLVTLGAILERCYTTPATGKTSWERVFSEVKETGVENNILSTDLGQPKAVFPIDGLKKFVEFFLSGGFSVSDVRRMTTDNQKELLR